MKRIIIAALAICALASCQKKIECSVPAKVVDGMITLQTPDREPGQQSALGLVTEPLDTVHVAFVGIGSRGTSAVKRFIHQEGVKITALCDIEQAQIDKNQQILAEAGLPAAREYVGEEAYKELCAADDIDLVYICTDWIPHTPIAVYAMEHGKHAAIEVPAAQTIAECWQLVNTSEKTRRHCMMLENCVYDFFEATCLNMAQQGLFGEIYHVEGAYIHNLAPYWNKYHANWRMAYNKEFRGDNYPTHGFGPVCQVLNIHRGDRLDYLVSMDTKSYNGIKYARMQDPTVEKFADGDHTISLIRTQSEKLIEIQHNVYASRPYSRMYQLTGTEGFANKYPVKALALNSAGVSDSYVIGSEKLGAEKFLPQEMFDEMMEKYKPEIISQIEEKARKVGGHGGMDFIMDYRLIYCLRNGLPLDEDVYDAAEWCCVSELSRISLENNSMPVKVPDFTRGDWNKIDGFKYAVK